MKKYIITVPVMVDFYYEVNADSRENAIKAIEGGNIAKYDSNFIGYDERFPSSTWDIEELEEIK